MKRFIKLMSAMLVLGAVATASTVGGNPEVFVGKSDSNPTTVYGGGNNCDVLEQLMGMCRSSEDILTEQ
jgi:hypothetical protein